MTLTDSHCHLADAAFAPDLESTVARAKAAGVGSVLCILAAGDTEEAARSARLVGLWPTTRFAVGVHPHVAARHDRVVDLVDDVRRAAAATSAAAIGEIGLDYHYEFCPPARQRDAFRAQLQLARELGLPVVIHTREAEDDTFDILQSDGTDVPGILHCFTGDRAMARRALDLGFLISFAGIVTFPRATELREVARLVPEDRFLVETDSPYLAPVPQRGRRNEPAWVALIADRLAEVRGESIDQLASRTTQTFEALVGPARPPNMPETP